MQPANRDAFQLDARRRRARIWLGGIIAYGISQTLNVTIFAALKGRRRGKLLWLRGAIASVLSQIVDTLLFVTIAFYGVFPIGELMRGADARQGRAVGRCSCRRSSISSCAGRRLDRPTDRSDRDRRALRSPALDR